MSWQGQEEVVRRRRNAAQQAALVDSQALSNYLRHVAKERVAHRHRRSAEEGYGRG